MSTHLYLIPNTTEANTPMLELLDLSAHYNHVLPKLDGVLAESLSGGRKWLKMMNLRLPVLAIDHTKQDQLKFDLEAIKDQNWAFVSDAGYPCIADPGWNLVRLAKELGYRVHLLPGTSAIMAAIALSGLSSQRFAFHGYLPKETSSFKEALKEIEQASQPKDGSWQGPALQVFIEVPHRYKHVLTACLEHLEDSTFLCVAAEVGNEGESIVVKRVRDWKKIALKDEDLLPKVAVFLVLNESKKTANQAKSSKEFPKEFKGNKSFSSKESFLKKPNSSKKR